ncbi:MAG: glycosyltransferase [Archangiaceae bacterium]|nr:glycosyltransferase [Archangiaceae bacterium]
MVFQRFDALLDAALPEILRIDSYAKAYAEWVTHVEPTLPVPAPSPQKVTIVCEGSPSATWLGALLKQQGNWDCIFTEGPVPLDRRFRVGRASSASTDFVLWVSAESELAPQALQTFAAQTDVDLAYADEDCTGRADPFFKPSFCRELARERDLLGGAVWVRRAAMRGNTPLDWALSLPERIRRIPAVLTHRTTPYVFGTRIERAVPAEARVSIIVPFRDKPELLTQLLSSIERHPPGVPVKWLWVDNGSTQKPPELPGRVLRDDGDFNWSRLNNLAAKEATGTHLLFLNNDVEAASDNWLHVLMQYACIADVGAVGANLWYPDGTIQHAGVVLGLKGLAGHVFARWREGSTPFGTPLQTRQVSAVTGACLLTPREVFTRINGFDESLPISGGDVDYCLRTSLRVLNVPHVKLLHHESLTRSGIALSAENLTREQAAYAPHLPDRLYNPNLTQLFTSCAPALERS